LDDKIIMNDEVKKTYLLNLAGELGEELETLFTSFQVDIIEEAQAEGVDIEFILVKNYKGILDGLASEYPHADIISLSEVRDIVSFGRANGKAILSEDMLQSGIARSILMRLFNSRASTKLEVNFGALLERFLTIKIVGHTSVGYYCDQIVNDALYSDYRGISMRGHLMLVLTYLAYLEKSGLASYPIDLNYGSSEDSYIVEIVAPVSSKVYFEYLQASLGEMAAYNPLEGLVKESLSLVDLVSFTYLEKAGKLIISSTWKRGGAVPKFSSVIFCAIDSVPTLERRWKGFKNHPNIELESNLNKQKSNEEKKLEGKSIEKISAAVLANSKSITKLERFVEFIQKKIAGKESEFLDSATNAKIKEVLIDYPNKKVIESLNEQDYQAILKALKIAEPLEQVNQIKEGTKEEVRQKKEKAKQFIDQIVNRVNLLELDDLQEFVKVKGQISQDDKKIIVEGENGPIDLTEEIHKIAGFQELDENGNVVVPGVTEELSHENIMVHGTKEALGNEMIRVKGPGLETTGEENTLVKGSKEDIGNDNVRIQGQKEELSNNNVLIKGNGPDQQDKQSFKIKGGGNQPKQSENWFVNKSETAELAQKTRWIFENKASLSNEEVEKWQKKREKIVEKLKEKLERLQEENLEVDDVQKNIQSVFKEELSLEVTGDSNIGQVVQESLKNVSEKITAAITNEVVNESLIDVAEEEGKKELEKVIEKLTVKAETESEQAKREIKKRDEQIKRMMKLMDTMRGQISKLSQKSKTVEVKGSSNEEKNEDKNEEADHDTEDNTALAVLDSGRESYNESINVLRSELQKAKNEAIEKEKKIKKMEDNAFKLDQNRNRYIKELENKIENISKRGEQTISSPMEAGDQEIYLEKIKLLEEEKRVAQNIVQEKLERTNHLQMSLNEAKKSLMASKKTELEYRKLQQNYARVQNNLKQSEDKASLLNLSLKDMDKKIRDLELVKNQGQHGGPGNQNTDALTQSLQEKDLLIAKLTRDFKQSDDHLKDMNMEMKRLEQKLKIQAVQANYPDKNKGKGGALGKGASDNQSQLKIKQLETNNQKLLEVQKHKEEELSEKKKELNKVRQEMNALQNKLAEFERKAALQAKEEVDKTGKNKKAA